MPLQPLVLRDGEARPAGTRVIEPKAGEHGVPTMLVPDRSQNPTQPCRYPVTRTKKTVSLGELEKQGYII